MCHYYWVPLPAQTIILNVIDFVVSFDTAAKSARGAQEVKGFKPGKAVCAGQ